ncbi:MAG: DUF4942 domain-containing protein [Methylococcaceae bacterium]
MIDNQFYPTPSSLAFKARAKFKNKTITRILEPSAGHGNLLAGFGIDSSYARNDKIDCIEIDFNNQAILRKKGFNVIDGDFMQFDGASMYSHIIMNPPFNQGAEHVIKAFNLLVNGELVAIVNAETVRNQHTKARKFLVKLIEDHGDVEFIESAFTDPDTLRKTNVEVALIWMEKKADIKQTFTHNLEIDKVSGVDYESKQELAIKGSSISNVIAVFNAAVDSLRSAEIAQEEASYYSSLLGKPLNQMAESTEIKPDGLQERFNKGYDALKKRAWTNVLHSTEFDKYLSSKAYEKLVADFDAVSKLSFTDSNIRGFLLGLVNGQSEMNMQMLLDCFDEITKYRPENRAYYRGWKSNQKHKEQAYQVMMTRFIIPAKNYYGDYLEHRDIKKLQDFDKTFAMLDGKSDCENSLVELFQNNKDQLKNGKKVSTTYFDVRYYPGVGTIHFYPTNKAVVGRMNRLVGKERQWLPEDESKVTPEFWKQYDKAEQITKCMIIPKSRYGQLDESGLQESHLEACEKVGIDVSSLLALEAA